MMTVQPAIIWDRVAAEPVALVLLPWKRGGTTVARRDNDGTLYGCRDVTAGPSHDGIVQAWVEGDRAKGLLIDDQRAAGVEVEDSLFGTVISRYTRAQAIEDGELVDVSATAREAGITFPVCVTRAVWGKYVAVPDGVACQDEAGRLWDIVWMLACAIKRSNGGPRVTVILYVRNSKRARLDRRDLVQLVSVCGPGDDAEPVITILLPGED